MLESKQEVTNVTFLVKRAENLPGLSRPLANSCTNSIIFPGTCFDISCQLPPTFWGN